MAKVEFKKFQEASAFSKNLAMTINATTSVHREGDCWCVEDSRTEQASSSYLSNFDRASNTLPQSVQCSSNNTEMEQYETVGNGPHGFINKDDCDKYGYNKGGYDINGFDCYGFDHDGFDRHGINSFGYDKNGYDHFGYDISGYNWRGFNKNGNDKDGYHKDEDQRDESDRDGFNSVWYTMNSFEADEHGESRRFDKLGFDVKGLDWQGFNRKGVDNYGHSRVWHRDIDSDSYDIDDRMDGFDKDGYSEYSGIHHDTLAERE